MAKNKGLTPKRKKIDRNPRVKHREKFRRAKIRRKGQVRFQHIDDTQLPRLVCVHLELRLHVNDIDIKTIVYVHQVRDVRREETRYSGELSGIRAGVKKSVKLK